MCVCECVCVCVCARTHGFINLFMYDYAQYTYMLTEYIACEWLKEEAHSLVDSYIRFLSML